jgi:hypothetical protein
MFFWHFRDASGVLVEHLFYIIEISIKFEAYLH